MVFGMVANSWNTVCNNTPDETFIATFIFIQEKLNETLS